MRPTLQPGCWPAPDHNGIAMFHIIELRWVWMPSMLRGRGVRGVVFRSTGHNAPAGVWVNHRVRQFGVTKPPQRFTCVHPARLSLARCPWMVHRQLGHYKTLCTGSLLHLHSLIGNQPVHGLGFCCFSPFLFVEPLKSMCHHVATEIPHPTAKLRIRLLKK